MRDLSHWNARYAVDRVRTAIHERRHPDAPWLTAEAVHLLEQLLRPTDRCFEWGSGRSTLWLARRTAWIQSVEHDPSWHARTRELISSWPSANVELVASDSEIYVRPVSGAGDLDVVLVDGIHRDACALAALARLRPGAVLVIDNVERYLPSSSRSPQAIGEKHETALWKHFDDQTASWRRIWTTNGVSDTALFFRP